MVDVQLVREPRVAGFVAKEQSEVGIHVKFILVVVDQLLSWILDYLCIENVSSERIELVLNENNQNVAFFESCLDIFSGTDERLLYDDQLWTLLGVTWELFFQPTQHLVVGINE